MSRKIANDLASRSFFTLFVDKIPGLIPSIDQFSSIGQIKSPTFIYLFAKNRNLLDWNKNEVPINFIWETMEKYALPTYTEYVETTDSPAFLEIADIFFKYLFWCGSIYVGCDYFEEGLEGDDFDYFSLWLKINPDWIESPQALNKTKEQIDEDYKNRFLNLKDGKEYKLDDWDEELIRIDWPLLNNFAEWFNFSYQTIINDKLLQNLLYAGSKVITAEYDAANLEHSVDSNWMREMLGAINNSNCVVFVDRHGNNGDLTPSNLISAEHIKGLTLTTYHIRDRQLAELGRVANTNPKGDRLSTGENYKDLIGVANRQRAVLNALKLFSMKVKNKGGPSLEFAMNGIPERSTMQSDSETAAMPALDNNGDR